MKTAIRFALFLLTCSLPAAADSVSYRALSGSEAQRLFENLDGVQYPADQSATNSDPWSMSFQPGGKWDGFVHGGTSTEGFGSWRVEGDRLCVAIKGGSMDWNAPFEGCFDVFVNAAEGTIAARFSELQLDRYVLKEAAFVHIANLQPEPSLAVQSLKGSEIKRLFGEISDAQFPEVGAGWGGGDWRLDFKIDGTWEDESRGVWGSWHVESDKLCIAVVGGDTQWNSVFEGCVNVRINRNDGVISGVFPTLDKDSYIIKENAFGDLARLHIPTANKVAQSSSRRQLPKDANIKRDDERRVFEAQRLALARERLALEKQKLEQEKQALALQQQRHQQQRQQASIDRTKPVIETTETVATTEGRVRIAGVARDDSRLTRVEVGGRWVDVDAGTGRFAAEIPVKLGRNRVAISATDANGNKAERIVLVTRKRAIPDISFGTYHAVIIGIDDYESLPKLKTAVADARAVAEILKKDYGYTVHLLENPTRSEIIDTFDELRESLVEEDNLLIYYAGHGWRDEQSGRGYWLPKKARADRRSRWVSNATLTDALQALLAKHVMVVADSCYSGTLTRSIKVPQRNNAYIERIAEKRARVVLSSGGLEPVADSGGGKHSVFAAQFLKALKRNEGVLDGTQLFEQVRETVVLNADQTPEYSDIRKAGHEGGDFLFVRKD